MRNKEILSQRFDLQLKNFIPDDQANKHWSDPNAGTVVKINKAPNPNIVFVIFVLLKNYKFGEKWEKVFWEISIKYKNIPMILSHKKFGFSIRVYIDTKENKKLAQEAIYKINKVIPIAEKLIEPTIKNQVDSGNITLSNDYIFLRSRYEYFREKAIKYVNRENSNIRENKGKNKDVDFKKILAYSKQFDFNIVDLNFHILKGKAASYISAMTDSYYSLLEHILVLLQPFIINSKAPINLSKFIGLNWGKKYKILFDMKNNRVKNHFDILKTIKETYRNPLAHGNFRKSGASLYVQLPYLGAIPMDLVKSNSTSHFSFHNIKETDLNFICDSFDIFDNFLENSTSKYGMMYIKKGLDVFFDEKNRIDYKKTIESSEEEFITLMDIIEKRSNDTRNMDW